MFTLYSSKFVVLFLMFIFCGCVDMNFIEAWYIKKNAQQHMGSAMGKCLRA